MGDNACAVRERRRVMLATVVLLIAIVLCYWNSFGGAFLYDDEASILYNGSIRHLWPLTDVLNPPASGTTVTGRPVLNLSLALDYARSGLTTRAYHQTNLLIHAGAALLLFGVVRRSLRRSSLGARLKDAVTPAAFAVALLWAVHPLQTEAVTYIVQRAEALMSLFYLLTLYAFLRSVDDPPGRLWRAVAWTACLLGMGTKENMVSAPLLVLLFDRALVAGSFVAAWRARRGFYLALAVTWIPLAALVFRAGGNRGGSAGLDLGVDAAGYLLTQIPALTRYLVLSFWPASLTFDYGAVPVKIDGVFVAEAVWVLGLLIAAAWALRRRPQACLPLVAALWLLAPTSLVPGTTQMIVEHRMYLPLAGVLCLLLPLAAWRGRVLLAGAGVLLACALGAMTIARNELYRSPVALWSDTVAKRPDNAVAHASLGFVLRAAHRSDAAAVEDRIAVTLNPNYAAAWGNLGMHLAEKGRPAEGLPLIQRALQLQPQNAIGHVYAGSTLELLQKPREAIGEFAAAARLNPLLPLARYKYGDALARADRPREAIQELEAVLALDPAFSDAYLLLATLRLRQGDIAAAQDLFARGATLRPDERDLAVNWGNVLIAAGHPDEGLAALRRAVARFPTSAFAHFSLGTALAAQRQFPAALQAFETTLRLDPGSADAHNNLGLVLAQLGCVREAVPQFEAAVRLAPDFTPARQNLERAREQLQQDALR